MGDNYNSRAWAIQLQLDSSNYCMFANLLSFLGIEEEAALVIEVEIRSSLDLDVHFERLHPGPFN